MNSRFENSLKDLEQLKIIYGRQGKDFALKICSELSKKPELDNCKAIDVDTLEFANGEIKPKILQSFRRKDVYVIQRFHDYPFGINEDVMELFLLNDAIVRETARSITNVLPCMPYARQDKKIEARVPISAKMLVSFLEHQKVNRIITMDLHAAAVQAFANLPIDNLYAHSILSNVITSEFEKEDVVLVSPDLGGASRIEAYSRLLGVDYVTIRKQRDVQNRDLVEVKEIEGNGNLDGKTAFIIDDMIDTGGTIAKSCELLYNRGAKKIIAMCTHPILSPPAIERLKEQRCQIIATDTVPLTPEVLKSGIVRVESAAPHFAEAIHRIQIGKSLSESKVLFP